ncbi:hypothetical protein PHYSODRAFT_354760 [Phytophthora sojae]|uniref:RxLR effector PexRD54 WY domain-containing protein n=2 Tax=Phytophthora sojae TaxID=67593 RepID=G4ZL22_PHYSP|nr:hypothetical protein PHYSODRAFT_354760 [Phytophthora sojae]AEK81377.1 Avh459 [Phytophthora sojae]AEK81379.1 Avh459 [Phytophthora sojae]EGZ15244.1 hypothetical protein PHYSODRAFT_354760 [Phytophthora sojae]|eukprot:XP_009528993.1 hypothetical protein PHYSODRAFT_354760 [Phytophthora sojae]
MTRVRWVVLLAVAALLASAEAYFVTDSKKVSLNSDVHSTRFRRINDDEERAGVSVSIIEKAKAALLPSASAKKLTKWLNKGKSVDEVFVRMGLKKVAGAKLFQTPQLFSWARYVDDLGKKAPAKAPTMIPTLTAQYGDEALARMIAAAKVSENADVKKLASKLELEQLYAWATKGKTPDEAFALFKLSKAGDDFLSTPQFTTLTKYLKVFNSKNADKETTMIATLVKSYGDDKVAKILQAAMKVPETAPTAQKLDTELVQLWLANRESTDAVFTLLKLDKAGDTLFSNPLLVTWTKYMNAFNQKQKNPNNRASLAATLAAHYGDDGAAAMLKSGDVRNILTKIKPGENLFENPHFVTWLQFVEDPRRSRMALSLMTSLTVKYGDEALIKMIDAAKTVAKTKDMATKLQTQQFQYWASIGKSPDDVFKLYELNKAGDKLLSNPELTTWKSYLNVFNKQNPTEQTTLVATMAKTFGDDVVVNMLEAAKKVRGTSRDAKRLESVQLQRWMKMEPDDVFTALKLDKAAENMFDSLQLNAWGKYAAAFNEANPDKKVSLIATMTTHYSDKGVVGLLAAAKKAPGSEAIATRLQSEQLQYWLSIKKSPTDVFKAFKLDKLDDKLLVSPYFSTWIKYTDDLFKNSDKLSVVFKTMRYYYSEDALVKMILAAEKNPSTQKIAQWTEDKLFRGWMLTGSPSDAFRGLKLDEAGEKVFEAPLFAYFTKFMARVTEGMREKDAMVVSAMSVGMGDEALAATLIAAKKVPSTEKIATTMQAEQIKYWLKNKDMTPEKLFKDVLFLDDVDTVLTNPVLNTWATYLQAFNANKPVKEQASMIQVLRNSFGDKMATDLETALLSRLSPRF